MGEASGPQPDHAGSTPAGHSRGSANGRPAVFEAAYEGSIPSPRTLRDVACLRGGKRFRGFGSLPTPRAGPAPRYANPAKRLGLNPSECGFDSHPGYWTGKRHGSVGNWTTILAQNEKCCGFDSRLSHWFRRVRKPAKRPSSNLGDRLRVRLPPLRLEHASAGHWRAQVAVTHPPPGNAGSGTDSAEEAELVAARRTHGPFVYRFRTPASHAGKRGSIPLRATDSDRVVELADTQLSEGCAPRGHGSSILPLVTCLAGGQVSGRPS